MLTLNHSAPDLQIEGVIDGKKKTYQLSQFSNRWVILFFYPADFTFVCPTEITGFNKRFDEFKNAGAEILGVSVDNIASHEKWAQELGGLKYPLLSDTDTKLTKSYGVLDEKEKKALRATFILSPDKKISFISISPMNVGRSVEDTLRVLKALQTGRLCPADWKSGEETLDPSLKY